MNAKEKRADGLLAGNPFVSKDFKIPVSRKLIKDKYKEIDGIMHPTYRELDMERHTKLFADSMDATEIIDGLTERGLRMFMFIMTRLPSGKDFIELTSARYMKEMKVKSRTTYVKARLELMRLNMITPSTVPGIHWINPAWTFNGSRPYRYQDNTEVKGTFED